jgi:DNA-binding transcriptional regulator YhcF (GntR family)
MGAKYWLKMYHESLHDPKVASLPDNVWRRWWECCLMAGELNEEGFLPDVYEMAFTCRISEETIKSELSQLAQRGMLELKLDKDKSERWYVTNFKKRQAPSPTAERMREYRKRKKEAKKENQITDTDTDTDTDTYRTVTRVTKSNATGSEGKKNQEIPQEYQGIIKR